MTKRDRSAALIGVAIGGLVLARVIAVVVLLRSGIEHEGTILGGDARRYLEILHAAGVPYRDRAVEYTPLTLGLLAVVDRTGVHATLTAIAWTQLALESAIVVALWRVWSARTALWYLVLGTPMLLFPFPYARIDLASVFLAVLGVALVRRSRPVAGGVALGLAVLAKVWPFVLAPLLLVRARWRGVAAICATVGAGLGAWVLWSGTDGIGQVLSFRGARGWQIESLPGILAHALDPDGSVFEAGAWRSGAPMSLGARALLLATLFAVVAWAWWRTTRVDRSMSDDADAIAGLLAVVAVLALAPILSTQYVMWMMPFAAIVAARRDRITGGLAVVVSALSTAGLAFIHQLTAGEGWAIAIVASRNLLLVVLGLHLARRLLDATRPIGTASPPAQEERTS